MTAPLAVRAALPGSGGHKLGARLETIATAAAEHRVEPLMSAALTRQLFQQNSPFEARWNAAGQVQVYLHYDTDGNPPGNAELTALGASDIVNSPLLKVVQAWIPANKLSEAAALTQVTRVSVPRYAFTRRAPSVVALPRTGSKDTEGDSILGAQQFRQATGYTGQGVVVGVISNGDSGVSTDQGTGDLPPNVWNDPNNGKFGSSGAEGTAMMEIVYDLAPGVKQLGFAGPSTSAEFLTALNDFATNINANVIVDDLGFPGEAMFTNGSFATGVQQFANAHTNIHLVTAAGNDATAFWAGTWNGTGTSVTVNGVPYTQAMNFGATGVQLLFQVQPGDTVSYIVQWNDPWDDSATTDDPNGDYDVVLFDSMGNALACNQGKNLSSTNGKCNQTNSQPLDTPGPQPVQGNQWQNTGASPASVHLEVFLVKGTPGPNPGDLGNQIKILIASQQSNVIQITPNTPAGGIFGQSAVGNPEPSTATPGEITVGAVPANDPSSIEIYSSQGPVQFGIPGAGTGTQPPVTIQKPDFVATDCVSVTGVAGFASPFCGTSAAAPHIAGLLALLISAYPPSSDPYTLLQASSSQPSGPPVGGANPNGIYGFGLPNMMSLLTAGTFPATSAAITSPASGASVSSGQSVAFKGSCLGFDGSNVFTYDWNFGSSGVADSNLQNPTVTFSNSGSYTVKLTCTNKVGSGSASNAITVTASRFGGGGGLGLWTLMGLLIATLVMTAQRRQPR